MDFAIQWYPSKNFSPGRRKYGTQAEQVLGIVDHITAGPYPGCRDWLCNPEAKASAHYIITRKGEIVQLVKESDTAWHAGIVNKPNWDLYTKMGFNPNRWCVTPEMRVLTRDLKWVPCGELQVGDKLVGFDDQGSKEQRRHLQECEVTETGRRTLPCYEITLADNTVLRSSDEHPWLVWGGTGHGAIWMTTEKMYDEFCKLGGKRKSLSMPKYFDVLGVSNSYEAGYISGMIDGEGHLGMAPAPDSTFQLGIAQQDNAAFRKTKDYLDKLEIKYSVGTNHKHDRQEEVKQIVINGGRQAVMRTLMLCRPERIIGEAWAKKNLGDLMLKKQEVVDIVSIEPIGQQEIVALGTSTHTYICEGYGSHNTIGIEHEEYAGDGEPGLTEVQYQASLWLHRQLTAKYSMPIDTEHIVGHYRIDSVDRPNCPGPNFPWDRLFRDLTGAADWKQAIMDVGVQEKIIGQGHDPDEPAPKWFVVATILNHIKK